MSLKKLEVTNDLQSRLRAVQRAMEAYAPGLQSSDIVDLPKLRLADLVLEEMERQGLVSSKARPAKATLSTKRSRKRA